METEPNISVSDPHFASQSDHTNTGSTNGPEATVAQSNSSRPGFLTSQLNRFTWSVPERYCDLQGIGAGAYGSVCSAYDQKLCRRVAIKKLTRPFLDPEYAKRTYRELRILAHVNHENILCLIDAFSPQTTLANFKDLYLVTPLMTADLAAVIKNQELSDDHIRFLVYQIIRALKYMHSAGLIHRDLKPVNIGVNEDCELKILDFGLARQRQEEMTGYIATRWYRAPEVMLNWMHYNESVDMWSVACIMVELRHRRPLFAGRNYVDQLRRIIGFIGKPDDICMDKITNPDAISFLERLEVGNQPNLHQYLSSFSEQGIDLLQKLLHLDPDRRLTAAQALAHPYFQSYHDEQDEPIGEPFVDPLEQRSDITVEEWKGHVWNILEQFTPKLDSLRMFSS